MIFVRTLKAEYLGLNGLFTNMLSVLLLVELGVGEAIIYSMYKPLSEGNKKKLKALLSLYKKIYVSIGFFILIFGTLVTPFLGSFIKDMPIIDNIKLIYILYVINTGVSYFFSYKRSLLIADQKKYIESFYRYSLSLLRNICQIIILIYLKSFILYLIIQLVFTLIENILISRIVDRQYSYIREKNEEILNQDDKNLIIKNVKALIFHKFGGIIVMGTDNILISKFIGIIEVGLYSNYLLITSSLNQLIGMIFQSITASIGNLGVTENSEKRLEIFNVIDFAGFWIYAFSSISLAILFNSFLFHWIGEEYLFDNKIVLLIVLNFYINGRRRSVLTFRDAFGLFWYDRHKPILESLVKITTSLIFVQFYGLKGIIISSIISNIFVCMWIEPFFLFKYGFQTSSRRYFFKYMESFLIFILIGSITWIVSSLISEPTLISFTYKIIVCTVIPNILLLLIYRKSNEIRIVNKSIIPILLNKMKYRTLNTLIHK